MRKAIMWLKTNSKFGLVLPLIFMADKAFAQIQGESITPIKIIQDVEISEVINYIVNIILWGAGLIAVIYMIVGGITYITAGGDSEKASKGRTAITNAIIGIVIIAASLAIYNFVVKGLAGI